MLTRQELPSREELMTSLEQALLGDTALRGEFLEAFENPNVQSISRNPLFEGVVYGIIAEDIERQILSIRTDFESQRRIVQTEIDYYTSIDQKIKYEEENNTVAAELEELERHHRRRKKSERRAVSKAINHANRKEIQKGIQRDGSINNTEFNERIENLKNNSALERLTKLRRDRTRRTPRLVKLKKRIARSVAAEQERLELLEKGYLALKTRTILSLQGSSIEESIDSCNLPEDYKIYTNVFKYIKQELYSKFKHMADKEAGIERVRLERRSKQIRRVGRGLFYAAAGILLAAGLYFGISRILPEENNETQKVEDKRPSTSETERDKGLVEEELVEQKPVQEPVPPIYEVAAEYKPGDVIWAERSQDPNRKKIVYQGIIKQDGRPFLKFLNDQIADSATQNHEIDEDQLARGFDGVPDCRPFLNKYLFDVDIVSQKIRLLRLENPFQAYGMVYRPGSKFPITELINLRPEFGIPNEYIISSDRFDPGKEYIQLIWLNRTMMSTFSSNQRKLLNTAFSTEIHLTDIVLDGKPDCVITYRLGGPRFYVDVNQQGDIQFLRKVR